MEEQKVEGSTNEGQIQDVNKNEPVQNNVAPVSPAMQSPQSVVTPENAPQVKYAGFWIRFLAVFIDGIILSIVSVPLMLIAGSDEKSFGLNFLGYIISWAYYIYMTDRYQATLGKKIFGLKVVNENFTKASLGNIILRETVGKIVSAIILFIGYIMAAFSSRKRALHDIIADTVVVYDSK